MRNDSFFCFIHYWMKANYIAFEAFIAFVTLAAALVAFSAAFMAFSAALVAFSATFSAALLAVVFSAPPEQAARPSEAARTSDKEIDLDMGKPLLR